MGVHKVRFHEKYRVFLKGAAIFIAFAVVLTAGSSFLGFHTVFGEGKKLPIYSVDTTEKKVAISFDAAWGNEHTKPILDILDQYGVKTTFFLVEFWVDKFPEDVLEIHKRGHEIGNHSSSHPNMSKLSSGEIVKELKGPEEKIAAITGVRPTVFRPPFGAYSNGLIETCEASGYYVIQWDVDSLDWKDISAEQIVERVTRNVKPGSIVLFHNNAEHVEQYLPLVIQKLQADGYQIVPVGQLIMKENYHMDHAGKQVAN
ncbi:polysaccharide deacetylase family protein [Clostridiales bacterium BAD-6]|uniref:Polysaccharide deacetylase family protein n=1 Tax=Sinanaerobacter chloroacetimidivorans TaxID=2818044 RepID=A0A8J7W0Q4_9FIRM|nr:polysaccharide deacetylase family protein [Sinanaerobacter chloroacetimidivorans]